MRIGFDLRVLAKGTRSGIEEYTINLLSSLLPLAGRHQCVLFYNALKKEKIDFEWLKLPNVTLYESSIPNKLIEYSTFLFNWPKIDRILGGVDVFLSPHFTSVAISGRSKKILVFHDLSFLYYPEFFSWRKNWWHLISIPKKQALAASDIIAVSESTKKDLIKFYGADEKKIEVIYQAPNNEFRPMDRNNEKLSAFKKKHGLPDKFILFVGTAEPRKNIQSLISAYNKMRDENRNISHGLVIAGQYGWLYRNIILMAKSSEYSDKIIITGAIKPEERVLLYNLADIFVYPSFFEGFGLPPLEAMSCGIPTIVSNSTSLTEVVSSAAITVDPYNVDRLSFFMGILIKDEKLKNFLSKKSIERAREFSWEESAKKILRIIEKYEDRN